MITPMVMVGGARLGQSPWLNRREVRILVFLASMFLAAFGALMVTSIYLVPSQHILTVGSLADFPPGDEPYFRIVDHHRLIVVNTGHELIVLDALTQFAFHQVAVKWVPSNHRFEDPEGGSKFELTGEYIEGPAPRGLDRYPITILPDGTIQIDPWKPIIRGKNHD